MSGCPGTSLNLRVERFSRLKGALMLTDSEKALLTTVLETTGDDEKMIRRGIIKALKSENDKARRTYLWNLLEKKAKEKIRRARRKYPNSK